MKISTILNHLDHGHLALPCFARPYVWNCTQVPRLFASLYRGYPVGELIFQGAESKAIATHGDGPARAGPVELVIDGQQRITSIYGVARGRPPLFFEGKKEPFSELYFNVEAETFEFYRRKMRHDPRWVDLTALFTRGEAAIVDLLPLLHNGLNGAATIGEYGLRLNRLLGIMERDIHAVYVSRDLALGELADIYFQANGYADPRRRAA